MFKLLQPASPKKLETGKSRSEDREFRGLQKYLQARVIMFRGDGRVKFGGDCVCPMQHGLLGDKRISGKP
jgi:hypothetical protein